MNDKKYILDQNTEKYQYELTVDYLENHKTYIDIKGPMVYKTANDENEAKYLFNNSIDCFVKDHEVEFKFDNGAIITLKFLLHEFKSHVSDYIHRIPHIAIQSLYCDHEVDQESRHDEYFSGYKLNKGNYKFHFIVTLYKVKDIGLPFVSLEFKNPKFDYTKYIPTILKLFKNKKLIYNSLFDDYCVIVTDPSAQVLHNYTITEELVNLLLKNELYKDEVKELLD